MIGPTRQILERIEKGEDALFTSRSLLDELDRVLRYPKIVSTLGKARLRRQDILRWLVRHSTIIMPKPLDRVVVTADPADDQVLACAVSASADRIVSGDRHLLEIRSFRGISILTAQEYLRRK